MVSSSVLLALSVYTATSSQSPVSFKFQNPNRYHSTNGTLRPLTFNKDGTFQVSIFEDLHFGENAWDQWGPQQDLNSIKVINQVLDAEEPSLVVLNGDLITGENTYLENSTTYVDQIVRPLVQRGLSWASTYGNHDHNFNISAVDILARERKFPGCRTRSMVKGRNAGVSNYYLPVYAPECQAYECAPELLLWFFDSRGGFYFRERNAEGKQVGQPDWVDVSVVNWFQSTNARIRERFGKVIPSLAFVHIPTNASAALQQEHGRHSIHPNHEPGINDDYPLAPQAQGWCPDGRNDGTCSYGGQDLPFMQAITTTPGLMGVFSGHDHGATWCYKWDHLVPGMTVTGNGLNLCFGQHSGYGGYGSWVRGARQVLVSRDTLEKKKWEAETWIRLESGSVVGSVSLNATYGQDWYPATPNDMTHCPTCNYTVITPGPRKRKLT
ncbi:hypothetical protein QQS21_000735 [Conoideocrella luteorostrata]|uniref:Calcineurin-like phosphoesterase domain-containing protein n=1 Tax=Conoideocrella luteorostrata TaxID=1105319 RepID=A0AAJ0D0L1_9HYPO|nr:hypothetical protein QQS21_000735 [Conoideocrella luteorostrata]